MSSSISASGKRKSAFTGSHAVVKMSTAETDFADSKFSKSTDITVGQMSANVSLIEDSNQRINAFKSDLPASKIMGTDSIYFTCQLSIFFSNFLEKRPEPLPSQKAEKQSSYFVPLTRSIDGQTLTISAKSSPSSPTRKKSTSSTISFFTKIGFSKKIFSLSHPYFRTNTYRCSHPSGRIPLGFFHYQLETKI